MAASATELRVDYIDCPLGLENRRPRFSWAIVSDTRDVRQIAYRVQVAAEERALAGGPWLWDSGRIASARSVDVAYDGPAPGSRDRRHWRVTVWLAGEPQPIVSEGSRWEMGLLGSHDWTADWIAAPLAQGADAAAPQPAALLRRPFSCDRLPIAARLYVTAFGAYEAHINGRKVGDAVLAPESTDFSRRALYQIHDVTHLIRAGGNVLGAMLGDGWYSSAFGWKNERGAFGPPPNRLRAQLELTYAGGRREVVATGGAWRAAASAIVSAEIYAGEVYDARREQAGWSASGFDDSAWSPARVVETPEVPLAAQVSPPIRALERLRPIAVTQPAPGAYVYDFGQNFAGWARLKARGPAGSEIRLRFAEILAKDGNISTENLRGAKATDVFILSGGADETFEPRFTYHGFRYVELTGYPGAPPDHAVEGVVACSDCEVTGTLRTSNPLIDKIWRNSVWSQKSNLFGVPTDCPQRDERLGWMGDAQVYWDAASYTMDVDAFTRRFLGDVRVAQRRTGGFPDVTPFDTRWDGAPGWGDAGVILPWTVWRKYGDSAVIEEMWDAMVRWVDWIGANNPDQVWRNRRGVDYGDWLAPDAVSPGDPTTPKDLIGTAFWAYDAALMAEMARATGRAGEADAYADLRARIGQAFVREFVRDDGSVGNDSQTSHVLALRFGLLPEALRAASAGRLAADIASRGGHLSTGFLGTPYILDALAQNGFEDVAVSLLLQTSFPSWGYMIERGATSMWERWNGDTGDVGMNSFNHYAYGAVTGFLYRRLAGIAPAAPGFEHVDVRPLDDPRLPDGGGTYRSVRGPISTAWRREPGGGFSLDLTLPANTAATVRLPAGPDQALSEGGRPFAGEVRREAGALVADVGSGDYRFLVSA
ncbi:MAG: family 78 glycoside hydrolase catalytic domain [Caulobacterales bacterium]